MRFCFDTLKRTISALLMGVVLFAGMAISTGAKDRHGRQWERRDNGRHLGWTRGRRNGWRNRDRSDRRDFRRRRWSNGRDNWNDRRWSDRRGGRIDYIGPRVWASDRRRQRREFRQFRAQQWAGRRDYRRNRF